MRYGTRKECGNIDAQELKEQERRSKNVVIHGIMEEIENTYIPWNCY